MKVTIKEIAERAGVHRATVDKVLHNRVGVSDEVRMKVQRIIKEMGYIESGDTVIVTVGVKHKNQPSYAIGETNNMRVIVVN